MSEAGWSRLRSVLDALYLTGVIMGAMSLITILTLIVLQMLARWTGEVFPGAPSYAGYAMAFASFTAFAYALNRGTHIRVSILVNALSPKNARLLNIWCLGIASTTMWYFAFYAIKATYWSWKFKDISQGQDATALWIPQSGMVFGGVLLALALTDNLLHLVFFGHHRIGNIVEDQHAGE